MYKIMGTFKQHKIWANVC